MRILIADDDPVTVQLLSTWLADWGYDVSTALDGAAAWQAICDTPIDVAICDWMMPGLDGLELCGRIRRRGTAGYIYLILISSQNARADILHALQRGVDDFIAKPIDPETLRARIGIGARIVALERSLQRKIDMITANHYQTIRMFSQLMEGFDEDLGGHCRRTAALALDLAHGHPRVTDAEIPIIETAALLHDIGMVGIPRAILNKRHTRMVADERRLYQSHVAIGAGIIGQIDIMKPAALLVVRHHEHYDGRGFPEGIAGEQIPIGAQLISAASIYDNLLHLEGIPADDVAERLQRLKGYQLSPPVVDLLVERHLALQEEAARSKDHEERKLDTLETGMVLAAPVRMKTGAVVMAADSALDDYTIDKLNHYHRIGAIANKVLIRPWVKGR